LGARGRQFKSAHPDFVRRAVLVVAAVVALAAWMANPASPGDSAFRSQVRPIDTSLAKRMTGVSWRPGCPVSLRDLRLLTMSYWGFDGRVHQGRLVAHRDVARQLVGVFRRLYAARFPIRRLVVVDVYGGSDFRSIEADNTSAFNCRHVDGTTRWSEHAYGRAIDVNPIENPYVSGGTTSHGESRPYLDRSRRRPGMAYEGGALVRAFDAAGWGWGGRWSGAKDYQHFSASGR
jgi:D-alanyl-D-alanine carboxypeptidase